MYREFVKWLNDQELKNAQDIARSMSEFENINSSKTTKAEWDELKKLVLEIHKFSRVTNNRPEVKKSDD